MAPPSFNVKIRGRKRPPVVPPSVRQALRKPGGARLSAGQPGISRTKRTKVGARIHEQDSKTSSVEQPRKVTMSRLESLPVELVQQVFFHCLEVNMVTASPHLTRALSQKTIYTSLILFAFFDDDGQHPVEAEHFLPAQYRTLYLPEKLRLQQNILKCCWCSLELVQACMPTLTRLKMVQEWYAEKGRGKPYGEDRPSLEVLSDRKAVAALPDLDDQGQLERHFFAGQNEFDIRDNTTTVNPNFPRLITWSYSRSDRDQVRKSLITSTTVLGARHIPQRLLLGNAWTKEKLNFLQLLRQGNRFLRSDLVLNLHPNDLFTGLANAIREHNPQVLLTLLELHHAAFRRDRFSVDNLRPEKQLYTAPFSVPLPIELFYTAIQQDEHASEVVATLLREGIDSIPSDDPRLTKWALRGREKGDQVAKWLLKHMEGTEDYGLGGRGSPLFLNGELNPRRRDGDYPFPDRSFTAELGYITHGAIAFIPKNDIELEEDP